MCFSPCHDECTAHMAPSTHVPTLSPMHDQRPSSNSCLELFKQVQTPSLLGQYNANGRKFTGQYPNHTASSTFSHSLKSESVRKLPQRWRSPRQGRFWGHKVCTVAARPRDPRTGDGGPQFDFGLRFSHHLRQTNGHTHKQGLRESRISLVPFPAIAKKARSVTNVVVEV